MNLNSNAPFVTTSKARAKKLYKEVGMKDSSTKLKIFFC